VFLSFYTTFCPDIFWRALRFKAMTANMAHDAVHPNNGQARNRLPGLFSDLSTVIFLFLLDRDIQND
jgi:hypothetical protein